MWVRLTDQALNDAQEAYLGKQENVSHRYLGGRWIQTPGHMNRTKCVYDLVLLWGRQMFLAFRSKGYNHLRFYEGVRTCLRDAWTEYGWHNPETSAVLPTDVTSAKRVCAARIASAMHLELPMGDLR